MKYFLPYWEDWVHNDFDPIEDTFGNKGFDSALFAHEIFDKAPYDGILISLGLFEKKLKLIKEDGRPKIRNFVNIKNYLRVHKDFPIMGDCGAFTYINSKYPEISVEKASYYYNSLGFDYGISVDHICSDVIIVEEGEEKVFDFVNMEVSERKNKKKLKLRLSDKEKEFRRNLSIENAKEFWKISLNKNYTPIGAVQGYSIETYLDSAQCLIDFGYKYLAFGGLATKSTEFISKLLDEIYKTIDTTAVKIHMLGVLREDLLDKMQRYNIYSFDSASYYRKSWLKATNNYFGVDLEWYSAIRVPQAEFMCKKNTRNLSLNTLKQKERKILSALVEYDKGFVKDIDALIEDVLNYDKTFFRESFNEEKFFGLYKKTLESQIWKLCNCDICKHLGINVIIFRGSDRNKRRGFHNVYIFYHLVLKNISSISHHLDLQLLFSVEMNSAGKAGVKGVYGS